MTDFLLLAQNVTSISFVIACWVMAHEEARRRQPGRLAAWGFAFAGMSVLATMFVRNFDLSSELIGWFIVCTKAGLTVALIAMAVRSRRLLKCRGRRLPRSRDRDVPG